MIKLLLDAGAKVNFYRGYYSNAFQRASEGSQEQVVKPLLHKSAHVSAQSGYLGSTLCATTYRDDKLLL